MSFRLFRIILFWFPGIGLAALLVAGSLNTPTATTSTLSPVYGDELLELKLEHAMTLSFAPEVTILRRPGWDLPSLVTIYRETNGVYFVGIETRPDDGTHRILNRAKLEPELAERIIRLVQFELSRIRKGSRERISPTDVTVYFFAAAANRETGGRIHGVNHDTTIERLCRVIDALATLPRSGGSGCAQILGEIDRGVTAIEVAYKQAKLLPP